MHVQITLNVVYDSATVPNVDEMKRKLQSSIDSAISNGLLSPTGEEVIDELSFEEDDIVIDLRR